MIYTWEISLEKINEVKNLLKRMSTRMAARRAGVSPYTAWCISKGRYDNDEPLHGKLMEGRCPITGFKLDNKLSMAKTKL